MALVLFLSCRFVINLRCDTTETGNIAMHMNPRFDGWDKVIFNTFENDCWGSEDKLRRMPFTIGESFELVIEVTSAGYKVSEKTNKQKNKSKSRQSNWKKQTKKDMPAKAIQL